MYRFIDQKGTGKTKKLLEVAKEYNAIVVCENPEQLRQKAYNYGITGLDFISFAQFDLDVSNSYPSGVTYNMPIVIDELDRYFKQVENNLIGYTISNED